MRLGLGLGALKAVLRRSRVLVCNDAGARHIAVAFGTPCVVVMGPTSLEKTNLNLERVKVLSTDVDCRPCYLRECPIDHRCMTRITTDMVLDVIKRYKSGVGFKEIQSQTGFEEKKVRNIIFRLDKIGKIRRVSRGIYVAV